MLGQKKKRTLFDLFNMEQLFESLSKLVETKIKLAMLDVEEKTISIMAKVLSGVMMGVFLLIFLFFFNFTVAFFLNEVMDSRYLGFAIVSGFYLLLFVILMFVRKKVMFKDLIAKAIEDQNHKHDHEKQ